MTSDDPHDMVRLTTANNPIEAHILEQALQQEGIHCQVLGDFLEGGIGNIPGISAELWVEPADVTRTEAIIRDHQTLLQNAAVPHENRNNGEN